MSLLPESASFAELVQDFFVAHRGKGLMLSALDEELVIQWAASGVPFEVVARGIRRAAEKAVFDARPGEPALRSLRSCKRQVDSEIKRHLDLFAGSGTGPAAAIGLPPDLKRHKKFRAALGKLRSARPDLAPAVQGLLDRELRTAANDATVAPAREERILTGLLRALPWRERAEILRQAREMLGEPQGSSRARKLSRRFHRFVLLKKLLGLPAFW